MVDLTAVVDGLVHEPTQTRGRGLDLTVAEISEIAKPARIDFSDGELEAPGKKRIETAPRNLRDEYEWWILEPGQYVIEFNESLAPIAEEEYFLQPRDVLLASGAFHPSLRVRELGLIPLSVGGTGLHLKENARISTLLPPK